MWDALSDERTGLPFLLLALASAVILRSDSRGTHDHTLLSQIKDSPNLEGQVTVFISLRNRVAQLCPQAIGSLFVTSYDSLGYGGGIRTRVHTELQLTTELVKVKVTLRLTVSQSVSKSWCPAPSGAHDQIFVTVWQLRSCFCGAPSLMRGRVCHL
jgi:hypothetical protein